MAVREGRVPGPRAEKEPRRGGRSLFLLLAIAGLVYWGNRAHNSAIDAETAKTPPTSASTIDKKADVQRNTKAAQAEDQEKCKGRLLKSGFGTGFITGYKTEGITPVVVVNERMWNQVDFNTKSGLAETFDCAIAGPGMAWVGVEYRSNMTGKVLATWNGLRLIPK
jgi:hypothetical protein